MSVAIDIDEIRQIVAQHGRMSGDLNAIGFEDDLYAAGLTSLATVGVMLALEDRFDVEFPDSMLSRSTFRSLKAIADTVESLTT